MATRRELMRAGRKLFSERGLYESRIEDLADGAGIAKGTLYLYFRNKEELIRAVMAAGYEDLREHVEARLAGARSTRSLLRGMVRAHLEFFARNPDLVRVFHQVRGMLKFPRPEWRELKAPLEEHIRFLADALGRASARSRLAPRARRRAAIQLYGAVSGIVSVNSILEPRTDVRSLIPLPTGTAPIRRSRVRARSHA